MGLSIWHLLLVLAIVLVLFGAKRLRNVGGDLGAAIKGFKDAVTDGKKEDETPTTGNVYDAQVAPTQTPQNITQQTTAAQPQVAQPQVAQPQVAQPQVAQPQVAQPQATQTTSTQAPNNQV